MDILIKIVRVPEGEMPVNIRNAWVGLILPASPEVGRRSDERSVLTGLPAKKPRVGFCVDQDLAIRALEEKDRFAAQVWRANGFPKRGEYFIFAEDECELIRGEIVRQRRRVWNEFDRNWEPFEITD